MTWLIISSLIPFLLEFTRAYTEIDAEVLKQKRQAFIDTSYCWRKQMQAKNQDLEHMLCFEMGKLQSLSIRAQKKYPEYTDLEIQKVK